MRNLTALLADIKVAHTVFALPFAVMSAFIAADGFPGWRLLFLIGVAMLFARSAAMAFNRLVDEPFDRENPRTASRALPAGEAGKATYMAFITGSGIGFVVTCGYINALALKLAAPALLVVFFYSYTKRFTPYTHFFLGAALALAPIGAWVAVTETVGIPALILGAAVVFWLAGLDTIYSCQDYAFDRGQDDLHSIPKRFGVAAALKLASLFHAVMVALLILLGLTADLSWAYGAGVAFTAAMLAYEHSLVRPDDLTRVNVAFFNVNGVISVGLMSFAVVDTLFF
jgi:4-hydroxybenzoate polyprenyltransferase